MASKDFEVIWKKRECSDTPPFFIADGRNKQKKVLFLQLKLKKIEIISARLLCNYQ